MTLLDEQGPEWFSEAIARPARSHIADSVGVPIHYLAWNPEDTAKPGLIFAHGYRGHAHWWDHIAPFFTEHYRVYALDFAGMGDSGWRETYTEELFTADLVSVIKHAGLHTAVLAGHSYGGSRIFRACATHSELISHAIVIDSYVHFSDTPTQYTARKYGGQVFADKASALQRFRLLPEQPALAWARAHIAQHSIREVEGGWNWKFDPDLPYARFEMDGETLLRQIKVPLDYVCGELSSVVSPERATRIGELLPGGRGPIVIPQGHHHLMLDQPLALISTLRALLAGR